PRPSLPDDPRRELREQSRERERAVSRNIGRPMFLLTARSRSRLCSPSFLGMPRPAGSWAVPRSFSMLAYARGSVVWQRLGDSGQLPKTGFQQTLLPQNWNSPLAPIGVNFGPASSRTPSP